MQGVTFALDWDEQDLRVIVAVPLLWQNVVCFERHRFRELDVTRERRTFDQRRREIQKRSSGGHFRETPCVIAQVG
jgi:hypothetical protein